MPNVAIISRRANDLLVPSLWLGTNSGDSLKKHFQSDSPQKALELADIQGF